MTEDFSKPKIIFQEIVQESQFVMDSMGLFCNDTGRIIAGTALYHLLGVLNSNLFFFAIRSFYGGGALGDHGVRMKHTFFEKFPCLPENPLITEYSQRLNETYSTSVSTKLEKLIHSLYGLTETEQKYIHESLLQ